jgi:hypothetical protein
MCIVSRSAELLGRSGRKRVTIPREHAQLVSVDRWLSDSRNGERIVDGAQRLPEELQRAVRRKTWWFGLERCKQPVEHAGSDHDSVGDGRVDFDTSLGEHTSHVQRKCGNERVADSHRNVRHGSNPIAPQSTVDTTDVARHRISILDTTNPRDIMRTYVLAFFGLALLLSACRIESNIILDINEDGSATVGAEVGFDEEMLDLVSQGDADPSDIIGELPELGGVGVERIERVEGEMTFFGATTQVEDLSTYDFEGFQGETFSEFLYEFDDQSATLTAQVDATGVGDLGGEELPIDPAAITGDVFSARVLVSMPGTVTEHNADELSGDGTLIWNLPLTGTVDIFANSTFGNTTPSWIWFIVGGMLIVGIAAAIAATMKSRKDSETAVAQAAVAHQAGDSDQPEQQQPADSSQAGAGETAAANDQSDEKTSEDISRTSEPDSQADDGDGEPSDDAEHPES